MHKIILIFLASYLFATVEGDDSSSTTSISEDLLDQDECGVSHLTASSGQFTSPRYPKKYRANGLCEWIIEVEENHVVEIKFDDFELGNNKYLDDYVLIYEMEENGDQVEKYFKGSMTINPNMSLTYTSKSNYVIVLFWSDGSYNFKGFNASYRRFSTKVTCENGSFRPNHVCDLIPYKVDECENTNLDTCLYNPDQLADYWRRKEPPIDPDQIDDVDFDSFPQIISIVAGRTTSTEVSCIDKLIGFSYCARKKKTKKFAFNCKAFTKFPPKKLSKKNAEKKMNACFKCRAIDCTATVYI